MGTSLGGTPVPCTEVIIIWMNESAKCIVFPPHQRDTWFTSFNQLFNKLLGFQSYSCKVTFNIFIISDIILNTNKALELLAGHEGWAWVNNTLIVDIIWPRLRAWAGSPKTSEIPVVAIQCLLRCLGKNP